MTDFEVQITEHERKHLDDLETETGKIVALHTSQGYYRSGATVKRLLKSCEDNHSAFLDDVSNEIRFFYDKNQLPTNTLIEESKQCLVRYRRQLFEVSGLKKLSAILKTSSVDDDIVTTFTGLGNREAPVFRKLEIELPMVLQLMTESFQLIGADGTIKYDNLKGRYSNDTITTFDVKIPIIVGDHLLRKLPSELVEDFIVRDPKFLKGVGGAIPDNYQITVDRSDAPTAPPQQVINNIVTTVSGDHSRVNISSTDNSTNLVSNTQNQIFQQMREAATAGIVNDDERMRIIERIDQLETEQDSPTFKDRYNEFLVAAAAHMTLFAPFIPALTDLLTG